VRSVCLQSKPFSLLDKQCKAQYAQMYFARLMELSVPVKKQAQAKWPDLPGVSCERDRCSGISTEAV
jgi:ABC-type uncharacterized transport system YnjBCD ATPase subunit